MIQLSTIIQLILFIISYHLFGALINFAYWDYIAHSKKTINFKIGKLLAIVFTPLIYLSSKTLRDILK